MSIDSRVGAYGLAVTGVPRRLLVPVPPGSDWPTVHLSVEEGGQTAPGRRIGPDSATLPLVDGSWLSLDRRSGSATFVGRSENVDELIHPLLAVAAVVFSWWYARTAFHGGAFAVPGGPAWALLGQRGAGKSSTVASLAAAGLDVVADDLLVVDRTTVFAGPRIVDLRPDAARELGGVTQRVRTEGRHRIELGPVSPELPLGGWVFLAWGAAMSLRRLAPHEWLERATSHLNTVTVGAPGILDLAGSEAWELTRPPGSRSLDAAVQELRSLAGA